MDRRLAGPQTPSGCCAEEMSGIEYRLSVPTVLSCPRCRRTTGIFHRWRVGGRRRWEDNIKMDLQEMGCGGMDWIELAQNRDRWRALVNVVMNLWVP
jgi:hypothetical protein